MAALINRLSRLVDPGPEPEVGPCDSDWDVDEAESCVCAAGFERKLFGQDWSSPFDFEDVAVDSASFVDGLGAEFVRKEVWGPCFGSLVEALASSEPVAEALRFVLLEDPPFVPFEPDSVACA